MFLAAPGGACQNIVLVYRSLDELSATVKVESVCMPSTDIEILDSLIELGPFIHQRPSIQPILQPVPYLYQLRIWHTAVRM